MRFPGKAAIVSFLIFFLLSTTASAFASPLFPSDSRYATGVSPVKFAAGDLDGDGLLDLAVVNSQTNDLSVLIGQGDGTFSAAISYPLGFKPRAIAVSDFNNDGYPDAAVTCYESCSRGLYLLLNPGDGRFGSLTPVPGIAMGDEATAADFNRDGDMDLAVFHSVGGKHMYSVLLGDGSGSLAIANSYEALESAASMVSGDFNGDGKPDIAFVQNRSHKLVVAQNAGDGSLQLPVMRDTGSYPIAIAQGLFDDDLLPDLAVVHTGGAQPGVTIYIGQGEGTFKPSSTTYRVENSYSVASGDLDGDGKTDLAAVNFNQNELSVWKGNGDGSFLPTPRYLLGGKGPSGLLIADLNGDGLNDLTTVNQLSHDVSVWLGNGTINLGLPQVYPSGYAPTDIRLGDFDGDGKVEAILPNWGGYSIVRGTSPTDFSLNSNYGLAGGDEVSGLAVADFNQDGYSDFALVNATKNRIEIRLGSAGSAIAHAQISLGVSLTDIAIGDFNGDGKPDIAVANGSGHELIVLTDAGDGTYNGQNYSLEASPLNLALGDYNGDGFEDIAVAYAGSNRITLLPGAGDGHFTSVHAFEAEGVPSGIVSADFNGDRIADLAITAKSANKVYVYGGSSDGSFSLVADIGLAGSPSNPAQGDFNGDGIPDLAVVASYASKVYVLQGEGDGTFADVQSYATGVAPVAAAVHDFNGDGKSDLLIAGHYNGDLSLLLSLPSSGRFELDSPVFAANEDDGNVTIRVNRAGGQAGVSSVVYGTADGSAIAGTDYAGVSGTLYFADGQTTGSFTIPILDNVQYGGGTNKSFTVEIGDPTHGAGLGSVSSAVVTIVDDENPAPSPGTIRFVSASYSSSRSSGRATVELVRTGGTGGRATVKYATSDGSAIAGTDYEAASGTYIFEDGEAAGEIVVPLADNGDGNDKTFAITLSEPSGGAVLGPPYSATVTITNAIPPVQGAYKTKIEVSDAAPVAGADASVTFAVYRSDGSLDTDFNGSYDVAVTGYSAAPDGTIGSLMGQPLQEGETSRALTFVDGEASATLALHRAGLQEIQFEVGQVAYPTNTVLLDMKTAAPRDLRISRQPAGSGSSGGGRLGVQPQVTAADRFGNPVAGLTIQASRVEDGRSWVLTGSDAVTAENGMAEFADLAARNTAGYDLSGVRIRFADAASALSVNSDGITLLRSGSGPGPGDPITPAPSEPTSPTTPGDTVNPVDPDNSKKPENEEEGKPDRPPFGDIAGNWAYAYIAELYADGIVHGYPDGTFRPNAKLTRAEFATLLVHALKPPAASGTPSFKDTAGHWAAKAIAEARASGIVKGFADQTFRPDEYLTREQMIAMAVRAFRPRDESVGASRTFTDRAEISAWAEEYIRTAVRLRWVSGYADGRLMPQRPATRAEAAKIVAVIRR